MPLYKKNYLLQKFGDSVKIYYDGNGNIRQQFYGSGNMGYDYNLYEGKSNHYYAKWKNLDSLYHYNVKKNLLSLVSKKSKKNQVINGLDCNVVEYIGVDKSTNYGVNQTFYYNKDTLDINPKQFKNYQEFFFYDYLNTAKHLYLKKEAVLQDYKITYELINYDRNDVLNDSLFKADKSIPWKLY